MPIFGDNTGGADTFPCSADRGLFGLFTLSENGTATEIALIFDTTSAAGTSAKAIIYTEAGALVLATSAQAVPAGGGVVAWTIDQALTAGNFYLGAVTNGSDCVFRVDPGTGGQRVEGVTYASPAGTMGTLNATDGKPNAYVTYTAGAAPTAEQEGFRFGSDDGSESAHTWKDAQDASITSPLGANLLLRQLINGTGDYATAPFKLKYQKNAGGGYIDVPVGASVSEAYGTVTFGAYGTSANGGATVAPTFPAGITAGQYLTLHVSSGATNSETPSTPGGWTLLATGASTDGTFGLDAGPRRMTVFGKIADGTESGTVTVTITNGNTCRGSIARWTKAGSGAWTVTAQGANDSTSGTGVSMTAASMNWNTGDAAIVAVGQRVDSATQSSQSLTASGVTFGARTNRETTAVTTGNDHRHVIDTFAAVSGTSNVNAAPTWAYTASAAASAGGVIVRLREYTAPVNNEVYVATSANIAAGGEATTARLTPPSGKTTGSFTTGRRWDDENGTDSVDIAADFYAELEWCLQAQSPAANGDFYDFRVYNGNSALDTYTVTPRWTIGSGSAAITEAATSSDSSSATVTSAAAITEPGTAADESSATGGGQTGSATEPATASDSSSATYQTAATITEAATAGESSSYPAGSVVPTLIAAVATGASGSTGGASSSMDTTGATQIRIVVESQVNTLTDGALTDNKSNSFVIDSGPTTVGSFPGYLYVYRPSAAPTVGTGHIFTINATGCWASTFVEAVGPSAGGTVSVATVANGTDTNRPYVSPSITPAQDNALLLGWAGDDSTGANVAWTWTSPSTIISGATLNDHNTVWGGTIGQRTVNAAGSYTMEASNSGTGGGAAVAIHSYTEVTSGGSQSASQTDSAAASESSTAVNGNAAEQSEPATASDAGAAALTTSAARDENTGPTRGDEQNDYQLDGAGFSPQLVTVDSQSGQVALLCVLGDSGTQQTPTDNQGNSYTGTLLHSQNYFADQWAPYNMRVYGKTGIVGGPGHVFSVVKSSSPAAEATLVAVVANAVSIQASSVVARQTAGAGGGDMVSNSVTTTGPALLVSFWSGDGGLGVANLDTEVLTGTGWTLLYMVAIEATAHIQHALAVKLVDAGTHTITWHNLGDQGAIISLVALQGGGAADAYSALVGLGGSDTAAAAASDAQAAVLSTLASSTEPATANDAGVATLASSAAATEPGAAGDAGVAALATSGSVTEPGSADDASTGTNSGNAATVTESATAVDVQTALAVLLASITEPASAGDAVSAVLAAVADAAEAATAGDLLAAIATLLAAVSEPASSTDAGDGTVAGANNASVTEPAAATDASAATGALTAATAEPGAASDASTAANATAAAQADAGAAVDSSSAARSTPADRVEPATAVESSSATLASSTAGVIEIAVAGDASVALAGLLATIVEAAAASDMVLTGGLIVGDIVEPASAADFVAWLRDAATGDARVFSIAGQQRTVTITAESRAYGIEAQVRTITITAQARDRSI